MSGCSSRTWSRKGLAPSTVAAIYRVFSRILATAETDGVIPRTPCRGIRLPRQASHTEQHFLTPEEVRRLAESIDDRYRALIYTAAYTGMRWGELAGLRVPRLDLLRGTIDVVEALTEVNGVVRTGPTKTGKSRTVSIPRFLTEMLAEHLARFPSRRRLRLHVQERRTPPAQLLPSPLQASGGAGWATSGTPIPRPPPHLRGAADRPGGASEGDPGASGAFDHPAHLRPVRPPAAHARRTAEGRPRRHLAGRSGCGDSEYS